MEQATITNNISTTERGSRAVLTAVMIGAVLLAPATTPSWLALVALYPAFTAMIAWDPIYQLAAKVRASFAPVPMATQLKPSLVRAR